MAQTRKYATLPDIDTAPDIYESSTAPDETSSPTSPITETGTISSESSGHHEDSHRPIDRQHIKPGQARDQFRHFKVDTKATDFSGRVGSIHQSYRITQASRSKKDILKNYDEQLSDEEVESLDSRVVRLRRELEEVRADLARINGTTEIEEEEDSAARGDDDQASGLKSFTTLSQTMTLLEAQWLALRTANMSNASSKHYKSIEKVEESSDDVKSIEPQNKQRRSVSPEENFKEDSVRAVKLLSDFDRRIADLEKRLGARHVSKLEGKDVRANSRSIITSLSVLEGRILKLTDATVPSLESISRQVQQLSLGLDSLTTGQKLNTQVGNPENENPFTLANEEDDIHETVPTQTSFGKLEQAVRINELYKALSSIEPFSSYLPELIERLRALRILHAEAAGATQTLSAVEREQWYAGEQIRKWSSALSELEATINQNEGIMEGNLKEAETWVKHVEEQIQRVL